MSASIIITKTNNTPKIEVAKTGNKIVVNLRGFIFSLPIASETVLGGVKVGSTLVIDENGVLNAVVGEGGLGDEFVKLTGDEEVAGIKTFTDEIRCTGDIVAYYVAP